MTRVDRNGFGTRTDLIVGGRRFSFHHLGALERAGVGRPDRLPFSLKVVLENLLRHEDGVSVTAGDIEGVASWDPGSTAEREISYMPARVLLQDFTGVPLVVDLAAMRDAVARLGGDPRRVNPLLPVDLVIDHSVQVDAFGDRRALAVNAELEFERNRERYALLRWAQEAFAGFRVVPPDTGIVHQVNLEYLAAAVFERDGMAIPDTVVGTDSHTTMINGLGVLGWGVGGIEAEAAMLGQPISMLVPQVIGVRVHGSVRPGATATDVVLAVTQMLRRRGVVGKFVEFFGRGRSGLSLADRATIANMAPEYGATVGFFPIDDETLAYLRFSGRSASQVALVEAFAKEQGLFRTDETPDPAFTDVVSLDLDSVEPSLAGPRRPQDRVPLTSARKSFRKALAEMKAEEAAALDRTAVARWIEGEADGNVTAALERPVRVGTNGDALEVRNGSVVIAAITSCTNTSNPSVLVAAGLLARNAAKRGLTRRPWVKTSLAPGSKVVTRYLEEAGLAPHLDALGFNVVGYGCTTCIGNSGPLPPEIAAAVDAEKIVAVSVLSGNRNFEGRINPHVRANYLASPPLVVAYAIAGTMDIDLDREPLGIGSDGSPVFLRDVWPDPAEVAETVRRAVRPEMFASEYADVFAGDGRWRGLPVPRGDRFAWDDASTYVRRPPFFDTPAAPEPVRDLAGMRVLAMLPDSITTDHISPAGSIAKSGPAGRYLVGHGVAQKDFNSYGARRGNHEVMLRGTFANTRLRNEMVPGIEGGVTTHPSSPDPVPISDAAERWASVGVPLLVVAGREYGSGSSRDWAAKGVKLLGVRAVLAESFERIHRSNLVQMGVLPLEFEPGQDRKSLQLTGRETFDVTGLESAAGIRPRMKVDVRATAPDGAVKAFRATARIDTAVEADYFRHGGILPFVLRRLAAG
ncbi:MAG: aconitate hydratase AcnA [Deltaproteobacteria bacterium]|nr:aconitate hydratase AcnA [Deltaproteobacteria bacterium]